MKRSGFRRKGRGKYGAIKTVVDNITFDSRLESQWYQNLKLQQQGGLISDLELQKEFVINVAGKQICIYISDYYFYDLIKKVWVIGDAKGVETDVFKIKKKLVVALYPDLDFRLYKGKAG